jgi:uncharacterized membrane protein
MESRAKLLGHSVHQMLIVFPLGLLGTSVIFDFIAYGTGQGRWAEIAFWMIAAGIVGGLLAAVFGLIDWLAIPSGTRAKTVGVLHALSNVAALACFAVSWLLRYDAPMRPDLPALILSVLGLAVALVGGWLGGELIDRLGVGVDPGAHLNAPNSLSGRPASENWTGGPTTA